MKFQNCPNETKILHSNFKITNRESKSQQITSQLNKTLQLILQGFFGFKKFLIMSKHIYNKRFYNVMKLHKNDRNLQNLFCECRAQNVYEIGHWRENTTTACRRDHRPSTVTPAERASRRNSEISGRKPPENGSTWCQCYKTFFLHC